MENKDYERILDALPGTGIYIIREDNHKLLYWNRQVHRVSPDVYPGITCQEAWNGSCANCPLLSIEGRQENRSISYNPAFGGVVDMAAARILWEDAIPAFLVTVIPRLESVDCTYREILRIDLGRDTYSVLKLSSDDHLTGEAAAEFSLRMEHLIQSGAIHPGDRERFSAFIGLAHLRESLRSGKKLTCIFRRQQMGDFRWHLVEIVKCFDYSDANQAAIFCVTDVHDTMREGLALETGNAHYQKLIHTAGAQNFRIYNINLTDGTAEPVHTKGQPPQEECLFPPLPWDSLAHSQVGTLLHAAYRKTFQQKFSLEALRDAFRQRQKTDLLCQWGYEGSYHYISVSAHWRPNQNGADHAILTFQDIDEPIRQELLHNQHDMQLSAILKSRYNRLTTVHLESGQCEQICLFEDTGPPNPLIGDYDYHVHQALYNYIHPEDAPTYYSILSLEHLRARAAATESYSEEACQYRLKGEPVHWVEQHVIYNRQENGVLVNILAQDITAQMREKETRLQELQDKSYIIGSLSSLFFATYYIDLTQDTFRAVSQLGKGGDIFGSEVNCTSALCIYANNFVHPEDREEYIETMSLQNWSRTLRWWHPCVTVTYRKMQEHFPAPPGSCRWIRATAVLAQTDADDMPKTVVYVAQDITESKEKKS